MFIHFRLMQISLWLRQCSRRVQFEVWVSVRVILDIVVYKRGSIHYSGGMVLVLNGVLQDDCPLDTSSLFLQHPVYRDYAQQLLTIPRKAVGPVGLLYVGQREMAATAPHDKNVNIIGTDDATTCIIVVVRHSGKVFLVR